MSFLVSNNIKHSNTHIRSSRFKLIPSIPDLSIVPNKPALIGYKLKLRSFRGPNYLELSVDVASNFTPRVITSKCMGLAGLIKAEGKLVVCLGLPKSILTHTICNLGSYIYTTHLLTQPLVCVMIEARDNSQLPEIPLGALMVNKLLLSKARWIWNHGESHVPPDGEKHQVVSSS